MTTPSEFYPVIAIPTPTTTCALAAYSGGSWRKNRILLAFILAVHTVLLLIGGMLDAPTYDEIQHVPAGLMHWETGRFNFGYTNPPLPRFISTSIVCLLEHTSPWEKVAGEVPHGHAAVGRSYAKANPNYLLQIRIARLASILFSWLVCLTCFFWASKIYKSYRAGCVAAILWCFSPFVLGHGHLATVDVASAAFGTLFFYWMWQWTQISSWENTLALGFFGGLACLTKFTWLLVLLGFPLFIVLLIASQNEKLLRRIGQIAVCDLLAILIINWGYGFDGSLESVASYQASGKLEFLPAFLGYEAWWRVPLPRYYVLGIETLRAWIDTQPRSYFWGQWRQGGWPHYYLIGYGLKLTCGTLILIFLRIITKKSFRVIPDFPCLAALAILVLVSSQTGVGRHLRYALPLIPLLFIWLSGMFTIPRSRLVKQLSAFALIAHVVSSLAIFPHNLSYFNELAAGPRGAPKYFLNSNLDWGQDLLHLGRWMKTQPPDVVVDLHYFGTMPPELANVHYYLPERNTEQKKTEADYLAVSANFLYGTKHYVYHPMRPGLAEQTPYETLRTVEPHAIIGYSIYIYTRQQLERASLAEANGVTD